jgi:hypothetical protein
MPAGVELVSVTGDHSSDLRQSQNQIAAKSGAFRAANAPIDPDLQAIIERWPELPDAGKASIVAIVNAQ